MSFAEPLVSVVVPVYNVETYVIRCLESIAEQEYSKLEVIVVDDGSTDASGSLCDEFAQNTEKEFRVLHKQNGGLSDARNAGIDIAQGEYILFVDSDDYLAPGAIECLMALVRKTDADIVEFDFLSPREDERAIWPSSGDVDSSVWTGDDILYHVLGSQDSFPSVWCRLYRVGLFEGIRFPVGKIHEDEFVVPLLAECACIYVRSHAVLYAYVQRLGSIVNSGFSRDRLAAVEAFEMRYRHFHQTQRGAFDAYTSYACLCICEKTLRLGKVVLNPSEKERIHRLACEMLRTLFFCGMKGLAWRRKAKVFALGLRLLTVSKSELSDNREDR